MDSISVNEPNATALTVSDAKSETFQLVSGGSDDHAVRAWQAQTPTQTWEADGVSDVLSLAWSGDKIAAGCRDGIIRIFRENDGTLITSFEAHLSDVNSLAYSPDASTLLSCSADKLVKLWRASDNKLLKTLRNHTASVTSVTWTKTQLLSLFSSSSTDGKICVWLAKDASLLRVLTTRLDQGGQPLPSYSLAFSPDGKYLAAGEEDGFIEVWTVASGRLFTTCSASTPNNIISSVHFSPDQSVILSGGHDKKLRLWNANDGKLLKSMVGHTQEVAGVEFSQSGSLIASASWDSTIRIWARDGTSLRVLQTHGGRLACLAKKTVTL